MSKKESRLAVLKRKYSFSSTFPLDPVEGMVVFHQEDVN
jgi:hypothetical protein